MESKNLLLLGILPLLMINTSCFHSNRYIKEGNIIVQAIEEYRISTDSLPSSLKSMGINDVIDGVLFCYEKVDSSNYIIWFGTTLGDGIYYYSDTKEWEDRLRGIGK